MKTVIDSDGTKYYKLKDVAMEIGLWQYQRVAQSTRADGIAKRALDINVEDRSQTSQTLYIDETRLRWLCTYSKCHNEGGVSKLLAKLNDNGTQAPALGLQIVKDDDGFEFMRIVTDDQGVWIKAAHVTRRLGYVDTKRPIQLLPDDCKITFSALMRSQLSCDKMRRAKLPRGLQEHTVFVNQRGVDLLIMNSKKPLARKVRDILLGKVVNELRADGQSRVDNAERTTLLMGCIEPPQKKRKTNQMLQEQLELTKRLVDSERQRAAHAEQLIKVEREKAQVAMNLAESENKRLKDVQVKVDFAMLLAYNSDLRSKGYVEKLEEWKPRVVPKLEDEMKDCTEVFLLFRDHVDCRTGYVKRVQVKSTTRKQFSTSTKYMELLRKHDSPNARRLWNAVKGKLGPRKCFGINFYKGSKFTLRTKDDIAIAFSDLKKLFTGATRPDLPTAAYEALQRLWMKLDLNSPEHAMEACYVTSMSEVVSALDDVLEETKSFKPMVDPLNEYIKTSRKYIDSSVAARKAICNGW